MSKKKICFIAHPIGGDVEGNLKKIGAIVRAINISGEDIVPFVPYFADCQYLRDDDPAERHIGISNTKSIFQCGVVDELHLYCPFISKGMKDEIVQCLHLKIPIVAKSEECKRDWVELFMENQQG